MSNLSNEHKKLLKDAVDKALEEKYGSSANANGDIVISIQNTKAVSIAVEIKTVFKEDLTK